MVESISALSPVVLRRHGNTRGLGGSISPINTLLSARDHHLGADKKHQPKLEGLSIPSSSTAATVAGTTSSNALFESSFNHAAKKLKGKETQFSNRNFVDLTEDSPWKEEIRSAFAMDNAASGLSFLNCHHRINHTHRSSFLSNEGPHQQVALEAESSSLGSGSRPNLEPNRGHSRQQVSLPPGERSIEKVANPTTLEMGGDMLLNASSSGTSSRGRRDVNRPLIKPVERSASTLWSCNDKGKSSVTPGVDHQASGRSLEQEPPLLYKRKRSRQRFKPLRLIHDGSSSGSTFGGMQRLIDVDNLEDSNSSYAESDQRALERTRQIAEDEMLAKFLQHEYGSEAAGEHYDMDDAQFAQMLQDEESALSLQQRAKPASQIINAATLQAAGGEVRTVLPIARPPAARPTTSSSRMRMLRSLHNRSNQHVIRSCRPGGRMMNADERLLHFPEGLSLDAVLCYILETFWANRISSDQRCSSKSVKIDASAVTNVQVAFKDLVKHALRLYFYFKNLQSQLREPEVFESSSLYDWMKLIRSLRQNLKMKTVIVILGSVMAGMLIMIGAPGTLPNSVTWALTEENLIFLEAWRTIDRAYIDKTFNGQSWFRYREEALRREPMNNREQTYAAIRKMLMTLEDPFTRFLEPEKFKTLRTGTRGAVTGVGLEVGFESNGANADLVVIAPIIGGPAERVGIVPGDIIREIDGMSTNGLGLYEAAQRLQGPESSEVKLTVQKKESRSSNDIVLVREKIKINPVSWRLCEVVKEGKKPIQIGYIRLATFNENASRSIKEAIQNLKESGATAYILDMRNNSGGLFPAGIEIANMWLEKGVIVYITDSKGIRDIYEADGYGTIATNEPLAVLVNKGTASASEILAGALKDNRRATILGEPTFGKGKIQSVFQLSDGSGMAVTVACYETPAHVDIDKVGITPDYSLPASVPLDKEDFCRCLIDPSLPCYMSPSTFFPSHK